MFIKLFLSGCFYLLILNSICTSYTAQAQQKLLVLGDSLSAGYGVPQTKNWITLLQKQWHNENHDILLINASISGETTTGGLARLPRLLQQHAPDIILIELGGNDALRGYPITAIKKNLIKIITQAQASGSKIILSAIQIPSNYGRRYRNLFQQSYVDVSQKHKVPLIPFFMEVLLAQEGSLEKFLQQDGIHPNSDAQDKISQIMFQTLTPLIANMAKENT